MDKIFPKENSQSKCHSSSKKLHLPWEGKAARRKQPHDVPRHCFPRDFFRFFLTGKRQSDVNGVLRKQFNGKSAFEMFSFTYSEELARLPGIVPISPEKVIQSPLLLKNSFPK